MLVKGFGVMADLGALGCEGGRWGGGRFLPLCTSAVSLDGTAFGRQFSFLSFPTDSQGGSEHRLGGVVSSPISCDGLPQALLLEAVARRENRSFSDSGCDICSVQKSGKKEVLKILYPGIC